MNSSVIKALRKATYPAFTGLKTKWSFEVSHEVPRAPFIETYFANELFILTALIPKNELTPKSTVTINLFETIVGK